MPTGEKNHLTSATTLFRAERHSKKELERTFGCSPRQAAWIVATGHIPGRFAAAYRAFLVALRARLAQRLALTDEEIRRIDYETMVSRAASRRAEESNPSGRLAAPEGGP